MSLVLLGVLIALVLLVFGKNIAPQVQIHPKVRYLLAALVVAATLILSMVKVVPPGHVGVLVFMGKVYGTITEGVHLINPLANLELMSVRTKEVFEHAEAPSKEGLNVALEVSCLYHLNPTEAANIYRQVGPNFEAVVVNPQFRAAIRGITVNHEAKDLYTSSRELIASEIFKDLEENLGKRGVVVETILLRKIDLPKLVVEAINAKLTQKGAYITLSVVAAMAVFAAVIYMAHYTRFGRTIYAMGGNNGDNEQSVRLMALPVDRTKVLVYTFNGFCLALAGILLSIYTGSGHGMYGTALELTVIAAVVIGGTALTGGEGYVFGAVFGVLITILIQTMILIQGTLISWWTLIMIGVITLFFIGVQAFFSNLKIGQASGDRASRARRP